MPCLPALTSTLLTDAYSSVLAVNKYLPNYGETDCQCMIRLGHFIVSAEEDDAGKKRKEEKEVISGTQRSLKFSMLSV